MRGFGYLRPPKGDKSAGFYPDPLGSDTVRWWDGANWTRHVRPAPELLPVEGESKAVPQRPRALRAIFESALRLYRRYPLLFLALAAAVVIPYDLIVLAATGGGPFTGRPTGVGFSVFLTLTELVLLAPLISALHVHAVADVRAHEDPTLQSVAIRGLRVLPVVAAATIMAGLGMTLGLVALIVPGVILYFRWFVVAQVAAIDNQGWLPALRGSRQLTDDHYGDIFLFVICLGVITAVPAWAVVIGFGIHSTSPAAVIVGIAVHVFAGSVAALTTALFYFDLVARREAYEYAQRSSEARTLAGDIPTD